MILSPLACWSGAIPLKLNFQNNVQLDVGFIIRYLLKLEIIKYFGFCSALSPIRNDCVIVNIGTLHFGGSEGKKHIFNVYYTICGKITIYLVKKIDQKVSGQLLLDYCHI